MVEDTGSKKAATWHGGIPLLEDVKQLSPPESDKSALKVQQLENYLKRLKNEQMQWAKTKQEYADLAHSHQH
jgi:hypothetical protein